jgi:hypothetical protein
MDISKEYGEMCAKAQELQDLKKTWNHYIGDFLLYDGKVMVVNGYDLGELAHEYRATWNIDDQFFEQWFTEGVSSTIWLPRMDQLAAIIKSWNVKYSIAFFQNIATNTQFRAIPRMGYDSIEKHLLAFVMTETWNKSWDQEKKEWITDKQ